MNRKTAMTSAEAIAIVKKAINPQHIMTAFVAGSRPEFLLPKNDIDIVIIVRPDCKDSFFNRINALMKKELANKSSIAYTFIKGPMKYADKGLIQLVVYLYDDKDVEPAKEGNVSIFSESKAFIKGYLKDADRILGQNPDRILRRVLASKKDPNEIPLTQSAKLRQGKNITFSEWKKTRKGWLLGKKKITPDRFMRAYLSSYYRKTEKRIA